MHWSDLNGGVLMRGQERFRHTLGKESGDIIRLIAENKEFAQSVAAAARDKYLEFGSNLDKFLTASWKGANDALGESFIHPEENPKAFQVAYDRSDLKRLADTRPSSQVMRRLSDDGFILLAGPPKKLGIEALLESARRDSLGISMSLSDHPAVRLDVVRSGWLAVSEKRVSCSLDKPWEEQRKCPNPNENIPNLAETVWTGCVLMATRGLYFTEGNWIRVNNTSGRKHIRVLTGATCSMHIENDITNGEAASYMGVIAMRKFRRA